MNIALRPITGPLCSAYAAKNAFVCFSLVLLLSPAGAQNEQNNNPNPPPGYPYPNPSMAIIIVVLLGALFLMGFFSIYIRHCAQNAPGESLRRMPGFNASLRRRGNSRGLDPAVIETFPTLMYSEVKGLKIGKGALECAVCLDEFEDDETLRLIPKCDHVFHPECIDPWLCSHVTCPVCRTDLVPQPGETPKVLPDLERNQPDAQNPPTGEISIRVFEDAEEPIPRPRPPQVIHRSQSMLPNRPPRSGSMRQKLFGKNTERFPRSHSTGHSLVQPWENTERFTLRLPEDVRKQLMSRAVPGEGSSQRVYRNGGGGDGGSSRGLRSFNFRRPDRMDQTTTRSDRWVFSMAPPFLSRELSVKSPKSEGSTSSLTTPRGTRTAVTAVRLPSFKCLEPKTDEPGLLSEESGGPSV